MHAVSSGPQISHLLFVDDLLLFIEASIEQAHFITWVCFINPRDNVLTIKRSKKKFSKNVDNQLHQDI